MNGQLVWWENCLVLGREVVVEEGVVLLGRRDRWIRKNLLARGTPKTTARHE
jgi:hypothetical protein